MARAEQIKRIQQPVSRFHNAENRRAKSVKTEKSVDSMIYDKI